MNLPNIAAAEFASRRVLMIQRAVRRNPRNPDFEGLETFMAHAFDTSGGVVTTQFDAEMAEMRKTQAVILKSESLLKEESEADSKRQNNKNKNDMGGPEGSQKS